MARNIGMARGIFKLVMALTADSAQLKDDLTKAERRLLETQKRSESWGNSLEKVFKNATRGLDRLVPGFSDTAAAIGKAIGSSKALAVSFNVLKSAIVATGIGALVIAVTALVAWLLKSTEGVDAFKKSLTAIKAVINTVLSRLAKLGQAIVKLLKGDFKGAAEAAKEAVSNLGEEIRENYREGLALGDRMNQQRKDTIKTIYDQADAEAELVEQNIILNDKTKTLAERQAALNRLKTIQANIDAQNVAMATEAWDIAKRENATRNASYAQQEAEADLYKKMVSAQSAKLTNINKLELAQRSLNEEIMKEQQARALAALQLQQKIEMESVAAFQRLSAARSLTLPALIPEVDTTGLTRQLADMKPVSLVPDDTPIWKKYWQAVNALAEEARQERYDKMASGLSATASLLDSFSKLQEAAMNREITAAGENEEKKEQIQRRYARKQKSIAIAQAIINGALAVTNLLANVPGSVINPATWVAIATAGVATAAQVALISSQPLAKGGIAYGQTLATIGEYANVKSNPEVVAPLDKLKSLISNPMLEGEVRFVIEQNQLVGILEKSRSKNIYF